MHALSIVYIYSMIFFVFCRNFCMKLHFINFMQKFCYACSAAAAAAAAAAGAGAGGAGGAAVCQHII